jgi:hypothetical protein
MTHQPRVKCVVPTCNHWLKGNYCTAERIDIWHEQEGKMAESIEKTECKSFHKREGVFQMIAGLHNANIDGIASSIVGGSTLTPRVHCIVSTCEFWADGDACLASAIEVTGDQADECEDTNCQTYRQNEEGQRGPTKPRISSTQL